MCRSVTANAGTPGESEPQTVWARASKQCQQQATRSADLVFLCSGLRPDTDTDTDADTDTDTASPDGRVSGQTDTLCPRRPPPVEFWHKHTLCLCPRRPRITIIIIHPELLSTQNYYPPRITVLALILHSSQVHGHSQVPVRVTRGALLIDIVPSCTLQVVPYSEEVSERVHTSCEHMHSQAKVENRSYEVRSVRISGALPRGHASLQTAPRR